MLDDVKRITGTVAEVPDWAEDFGPGLFTIHTDRGPVGTFRLAGHDIRPGDRIDGDWSDPDTLDLLNVQVTHGDAAHQIPRIRFV